MKTLEILRQLGKELGAEIYLAGGAVRDLVRGHNPNDLDFVVRNVEVDKFESFLQAKGKLNLVGKSFGVYIFSEDTEKISVEIAFPRTEVSTGEGHKDFRVVTDPGLSLEEDARRRDFTCNAMYLPLEEFNPGEEVNKRKVLDFNHGIEHIKRRLIVAVGDPEKRIEEDPLRLLRAMVLLARTGYRLEGGTFGALKKKAPLIKSVPAERIGAEFIKIMESEKPSRAFKAMQRCGLLGIVLPEVRACVGCGQNPKHHSYPVFEHIIYAADAACSITSPDNLEVRLAALCHDLGKAPTRAVRPGGDGPDDVSFHNHEVVSTHLTYSMLRRLKLPNELVERVAHLVRLHQYKYERTWTDKAVRRFIRNCGITRADLANLNQHPQFLVRQADRMGNALKAHLPVTDKQKDFQERIIKVYNESSAHSLRDLAVNGKILMEELSLDPTPAIGLVLKHLFDFVEDNPTKNDKASLLGEAKEFLKKLPSEGSKEGSYADSDPYPVGPDED